MILSALSQESLDLLEHNQEEIAKMRARWTIYQTFGIVCPKCGSTVKISNNGPSTGVLTLDRYGSLEFNCEICKEHIPIPIKLN
jgi:hypothetical protein